MHSTQTIFDVDECAKHSVGGGSGSIMVAHTASTPANNVAQMELKNRKIASDEIWRVISRIIVGVANDAVNTRKNKNI